ncbi:hypothetical protein G4G27_06185 [Sphingomonas sp. So64.6b]|uniref:hypothetical protein n=1 Tax=Sphingomonas sp. So64.6b TaxID=2997354 RepID=UPI00160119F9|nr:hypothetical protein [Sphingomonas sp. So64.6b]QNA83630.1 hypothetical protein G4G27_06185 [Sphingomonas sp. So64.6b]
MLDFLDHIASVATAVVAMWLWVIFVWRVWRRRWALNKYLKDELAGYDRGQRSLLRISGELKMTETEVLDAAFGSKNVEVVVVPHPQTGYADRLLFRYIGPR